jgi:hypothetical protein
MSWLPMPPKKSIPSISDFVTQRGRGEKILSNIMLLVPLPSVEKENLTYV